MNNNNNKTSIFGVVDYALLIATIIMVILKYVAGNDIPTIVVFTPLIAIVIMFAIQLITVIFAAGIMYLIDLHQENKRWHNFNRPFESSHKIYWNPETKEMEGVEPMPEYDKWKDEE